MPPSDPLSLWTTMLLTPQIVVNHLVASSGLPFAKLLGVSSSV
jgi:hypothetical protein